MIKSALSLTAAALLLNCISAADAVARPDWCGEQGSLNAAERTICNTRSLWALDEQLNTSYPSAMNVVGPQQRPRLQSSQREWLKARNGCGGSTGCLTTVYNDRIQSLEGIIRRGGM